MGSELLGDDLGSVLATALDGSGDRTYVVNPDRLALTELVDTLNGTTDTTTTVLAAEGVVKGVMDDFLVASKAADLVNDDALSLHVVDSPPNHSLVLADGVLTALVEVGDVAGGLTASDDGFVDAAWEYYADVTESASEYTLRTPPLSRVRETLEADIGADVAADFDTVLTSLETARGNGDGLDEVTISLLVAARNGELLYDISKWGEDVGLASKATFSRTKTTLEDLGMIDTEKVPIDVGRPRLRLMLGDDRLESADADELATVVQSLMVA